VWPAYPTNWSFFLHCLFPPDGRRRSTPPSPTSSPSERRKPGAALPLAFFFPHYSGACTPGSTDPLQVSTFMSIFFGFRACDNWKSLDLGPRDFGPSPWFFCFLSHALGFFILDFIRPTLFDSSAFGSCAPPSFLKFAGSKCSYRPLPLCFGGCREIQAQCPPCSTSPTWWLLPHEMLVLVAANEKHFSLRQICRYCFGPFYSF